jgi:hypothetical protein
MITQTFESSFEGTLKLLCDDFVNILKYLKMILWIQEHHFFCVTHLAYLHLSVLRFLSSSPNFWTYNNNN